MSVTAVSTASPSRSGPRSRARRANPWLTLIAVGLGLFMVGLDGSVVSIANAEIARDLNASTAELQWVTNSYLLALAAVLILGGTVLLATASHLVASMVDTSRAAIDVLTG